MVPESLREGLLTLEHDSPLAGHPGEAQMFNSMRRFFYWQGMATAITNHVRACHSRVQNRVQQSRRSTLMKPFPASEANEQVAVDLLGPL